ncbi:MAG TPA: chromate transporter [Pseudorhodoplanes sp.]|jgi:chromate transporter|nr:chromate transporter [Pseudorhodoplanes sp.]
MPPIAADSSDASTQFETRPPLLPSGPFELFLTFAKMSLSGFGGVLPWARRMIVEDRRWMSAEEFNEAFALAQFLPGPNIVNFSAVFGSRIAGPLGAVVAFLGLLAPPTAVVIVLAILYARYGEIDLLQRALEGVTCAAAGLIVAVIAKMSAPIFRKPFGPAPLVALAAFIAVGVLRWPLPYVLGILAPLSAALSYWRLRA